MVPTFPFDGNTPIGKDQSGRGNDFATPVSFGGSNCHRPRQQVQDQF